MRKIASVVAIAAGLVALLMFAVVTAAPDEPFASTVTIEPSYSGSDTAVKVGDIFTQRVRFERTDSTGLLQFEIQIAKSIMFETFTRPTISKSGNVSTNKVFQTDEAFHYRGTVDGNGIVEIGMAARVGDCGKPPEQCPNTISVNILNSSGEVVLSEDDEVQLVAGDFDRSQVSIEPTYLSGPSQTEAECLIDCEPTLVVLKNDNPVPARIVVRGETPNGMKWSGSSNSLTSNMDIPAGRSADSSDSVRVFDVSIQANETISLPLYVALTDNRADDASFTLELKACVEAAGNLQCPFDDGLVDLDDLIYRSRRRDLGDAPDSSNHFAVAIDAYTGVLGNFPTTADTSLAAPHGPAHARPWPLHLGSRVSFEAAADVGPDQDGVNNIEPGAVTPLANLDRGDDGIRLDRVSFNSCEVATIPVQVAIAPVVAANLEGPAYINVWLDGNRDGDWDDGANCDTTAYEHIVIDHEVDVATLGAGLHTISVTTSLIPKEINDSTAGSWMRVMLSDEKSTKLTGQSYGDGRGKGSPYTFGETEDYLYYAADSDGYQPEIELTIEQVDRGDERREAVDGRAPDALSPSYRELIIRYRNNGFESAENLEIDVTLGDPTDSIAYALQSWCLTCVRSIKDGNPLQSVERSIEAGDSPDFRFRTFQIGTLEPGGFGRIILGWHGCLTCTRAVDASVAHSIVAKAGAKQWQVQALRADDKFNSPFVRLGWTGCLTCVRTIEDADTASVINWDSTLLHVKAQPGQTIKVLKNGVETGQSGTADSDGIWSSTISVDPNEREVYQAVAVQAGLESEPSNGLDVSCPSSGVQILAIAQTDEEGKVKFVPPLRATEGITVPDVRYMYTDLINELPANTFPADKNILAYRNCRDQETDLELNYGGEDINFESKSDVGNVTVLSWTGCLTCTRRTPDVIQIDIALDVMVDGFAEPFEYGYVLEYGTPGHFKVTDADTGEAIADAEITVLRKVERGNGRTTWVDVGHCVTTLKDGSWSALVPEGEYAVKVEKDGYQTYRSQPFAVFEPNNERLFDKLAGRYELGFNIGMPPAVSSAKQPEIVDVSNGNLGNIFVHISANTPVRFENNGGADTSLTAQIDGRGPNATTIDSGVLASGESFTYEFTQPGTYTYRVAGDSEQEGVIVVTSSGSTTFLPMITR